jgi:hypothetical protein
MDFSKPWTVSLRGNHLVPCDLVKHLIEKNAQPPFWEPAQEAWSRDFLASELAKRPIATEALWESVLALWRLKVVEDVGTDDAIWVDHVEAWMVCVRDSIGGSS